MKRTEINSLLECLFFIRLTEGNNLKNCSYGDTEENTVENLIYMVTVVAFRATAKVLLPCINSQFT